MRVLVTGSEGRIGRWLVPALEARRHRVVRFDLRHGSDILNRADVRSALVGCEAAIHLAAVAQPDADPELIHRVNVEGTGVVVACAALFRIRTFVYCSSANALGIFRGSRAPDYFPIDDAHPSYASKPYDRSKIESEELVAELARRGGASVVAFRPCVVRFPPDYHALISRWRRHPEEQWVPYWEYGAFVDVRDVVAAIMKVIENPPEGFHTALLCARQIAATRPTMEMLRSLHPHVPLRRPLADPCEALVESATATRVLGWTATVGWGSRRDDRCAR